MLDSFERLYFNNLTLVVDPHFVHRLQKVAGSDDNPLNKAEFICDALMNRNGMLRITR